MEEDKIAMMLTLPEGIRPQSVITIGYTCRRATQYRPKYTLENVMYFRQFGGAGGNRIRIFHNTRENSHTRSRMLSTPQKDIAKKDKRQIG